MPDFRAWGWEYPSLTLFRAASGKHVFHSLTHRNIAPIARGATITTERYQDIIRQVRQIKRDSARRTIAYYLSGQQDGKSG